MKGKVTLLLTVVFCLTTALAFSQEQSGSIFGTVMDKDGAVIAGAKIVVKSPSLIRSLETFTNDKGVYVFPSLPVGLYDVYFSAEKYKEAVQKDIPLTIGSQLRINATLEVGVVGEEIITVTGETPLIDVKSTDTGMSITKEMFAMLPKGRNFTSVVALAPGANDENVGMGIMIDGATAVENIWVIDGVDVTSIYTGQPTQTAVFEFIEEVQVRSGGYEAEFGGSMGGVVNVVTRSGGNEFHGEGSLYFNNNKLDGAERPTYQLNPVDLTQAQYRYWGKDSYNRYELGGGIGGYILKDRIWFFGSYMPAFTNTTRTVNFRNSQDVVEFTKDYPQDVTTHQAAIKVSGQITSKLRVSGSYLNDWYKVLGSLPSAAGTDNKDVSPGWEEKGNKQPGWDAAASVDYLLSDSIYASVKGGFHYQDYVELGTPQVPLYQHFGNGIQYYKDDPAFASVPSQYIVPLNYMSRPHQYVTTKNIQEKNNWSGDVTYFAELDGSHMFKGGIQYFWIAQDISSAYDYDWIRLYWGKEYVSQFNEGVSGMGKYGYYLTRCGHPKGFGTIADVSSARYALFLQDSWSITPKMTVNFGVRAEKEDIPSFSDLPEYEYPPVRFGFADKFVPRLGVAYDVYGNGKLKLFGNMARYYDVMKLAMALGSYGGFKWRDRMYTLDTLEWWTLGGKVGSWPRGNFPGTFIEEIDWRIPSFETTDPDLKPTGTDEYIFGADYQLAENMAINARFVHKRLVNAIEDVGVAGPSGEEYYNTNPGYGYSVTKRAAEGLPACAKAVRHYWAIELRLTKRFSNNWSGGGNLTISKLTGNYSGLGSTDEYGRSDPNVERYFDLWFMDYDHDWALINGDLPTDRRYQLKIYGQYSFPEGMLKGLTIGAYQTVQDGTPLTTAVYLNNATGYQFFNRGDLGRIDIFYQTDLYAEYNFNLGNYRAQFNVNIINLFDQDTPWRIYNRADYDTPKIGNSTLVNMYNTGTPIDFDSLFFPYTTFTEDPRYGNDYGFQSERQIRFGLKFFF